MTHAAASVGFFGKLPSAGDFVQRRLPADFVQTWDQHFERAVAESRVALGPGWQRSYQASPVWRFVLAAGACGGSAWAGVLGPAADRVGRCFPMVIASALDTEPEATLHALSKAAFFEGAEGLLRAAQQSAFNSVEAFDAEVLSLASRLGATAEEPMQALRSLPWRSASHWRLPLPPASVLLPAYLRSLWAELPEAAGPWCLWWTAAAGRVPATVLTTCGLPEARAYAAFLDASQADAMWQTAGRFEPLPASAEPASQRPQAIPELPAAQRPMPVARDWCPLPPSSAAAGLLPDDLSDLLPDLASAPAAAATAAPQSPAGFSAVLHRHDSAVTLVAADSGERDPLQQAAAAVFAATRELSTAELADGLITLRTRVLALHQPLRRACDAESEPASSDCSVAAVQVNATGHTAVVLRIGAASAWRWHRRQLLPLFPAAEPLPLAMAGGGEGDELDDLLFCPISPTVGLGGKGQPVCDEALCAVEPGDRLLLAATHRLVQLPPDVLARGLAMPSCEEAHARIAAAAGLPPERSLWAFSIVEVEA